MSSPTVPSDCGYYGYASSDGTLRLYSESECNSLGGQWGSSGECLWAKTKGGSATWDCRGLNKDSIATAFQYRYYIGGAILIGGLLYWRSQRKM